MNVCAMSKRNCFKLVYLVLVGFVFYSIQSLFTDLTVVEETEEIRSGKAVDVSQWWPHPQCNCLRLLPTLVATAEHTRSDCGPAADVRGSGQKVVSYSFYGSTNSGYFKGLAINVEAVSKLYKNWTVRLYHDIPRSDLRAMSDLCDVVCKYSILDDCYVGDLEHVIRDLPSKFGMLWRFVVMGDPLVDMFAIRDLDSRIHQREVDAVSEWILENKTFHIMRDNPAHVTFILGGMWGAMNHHNLLKMQSLRSALLSNANFGYKGYDQQLLTKIVWPAAQESMVAHDSFLCYSFPNTKPWPTQRVNRTFVGDMYGLSIDEECPAQCRPQQHQDWLFC